jgi:homoserine kinase
MARPQIGQGVVVDVPATTANLGPGFDCLGAAVDLNNRFELRCLEGGGERFDLIIEGSEGSHLRGGPDNLMYRAAQRVWREAELEPVGLEARVRLAVPPARGLGSSATAIVAGLIGANALAGEPLGTEKLLELAIELEGHPDNVVPSLLGGLCLTARTSSPSWLGSCCATGGGDPFDPPEYQRGAPGHAAQHSDQRCGAQPGVPHPAVAGSAHGRWSPDQ